jgi:hypothetical protein
VDSGEALYIRRHLLFRYTLPTVLAVLFTLAPCVFPEPVPATYKQGSLHGFLLLKSQEGKVIAVGDQINVVHGNEIHSQLIFHFRDGSIDDETADYRQGSVLQLIRDRHIQEGPSFPKPLDITVNVRAGEVTWREEKDGKTETKSQHMDLPPDLVNGMIGLIAANFPAKADELKTSFLAFDPKPRVVKFSVKPDGEDRMDVGGAGRRVNRFNVHIEIGGLAGAIAPIVGKQPSDMKLWAIGGEAPMFVKMEGALYPTGPIWTMVLTSPTWPSDARGK